MLTKVVPKFACHGIILLTHIWRKATYRAETKASMEGSRVEALPAVLVKVAAAIVAAPGDVILRPLPALTVVSAVANLAGSLLAATNVLISASDLILLSTTRTKVTAPLRAAEDVMATPDLYARNGAAICGTTMCRWLWHRSPQYRCMHTPCSPWCFPCTVPL